MAASLPQAAYRTAALATALILAGAALIAAGHRLWTWGDPK